MHLKLWLSALLALSLVACSSLKECLCEQDEDQESLEWNPPDDGLPTPIIGLEQFPATPNPTAPQGEPVDLKLAIAIRPQLLGLSAVPKNLPTPANDVANFMTLMAQNGSVVTVWALAQRNWLWGYPIFETHSFGAIRNWRMERIGQSFFRFVNQQLNSCIEAYGNGIIHNGCDRNNLAQQFEILPTDTGSVFVKSVAQNRCLTTDVATTTGYFSLTLQQCNDQLGGNQDQNWYLAPPLLLSETLN